jgi:hypothetical protein
MRLGIFFGPCLRYILLAVVTVVWYNIKVEDKNFPTSHGRKMAWVKTRNALEYGPFGYW